MNKFFLMSNLKLPWCSLRLCTVTCCLGEEPDSHLAAPSYQRAVESKKVTPGHSLLQVKQPQRPQPCLITLVIQTLPQLLPFSGPTSQGCERGRSAPSPHCPQHCSHRHLHLTQPQTNKSCLIKHRGSGILKQPTVKHHFEQHVLLQHYKKSQALQATL